MVSDFEKRWAARERYEPEKGYNLVGVDTYEREPGEELYLVGHYPTKAKAEAAKARRLLANPSEILHIYGPRGGNV